MIEIKEKDYINNISNKIIGAALEVHKILGPGLYESVYEECLCFELEKLGLKFQRQKIIPVLYKGNKLEKGFRVDILVEDSIIVEIKAVNAILPIHEAQVISYLKMSNLWLGIIVNFNVTRLKEGIKRIVNGY